MIIFEGPDGAGKTTILEEVKANFNLEQVPRHVSSAGPTEEQRQTSLFSWAAEQVQKPFLNPHDGLPECKVYDRHPFISEYVYGTAIRNTVPAQFLWPSAQTLIRQMAFSSLVVLCLPPFEEVLINVFKDDTEQMKGVRETIHDIYYGYQLIRVWYPNPTNLIVYDYTLPHSRAQVMARIGQHQAAWNGMR